MKKKSLILLIFIFLSSTSYAQKDTVFVQGYQETGTYGTLNDAIESAINKGTINHTVFYLTSNDKYVLSKSIFLDHGQNLEIVAAQPLEAGEADSATVQNSAPPQILWIEDDGDYTTNEREYIIQSHGDIIMKNIWIRYADILGEKVMTSIVFENQNEENDPETGIFDGCLFDYAGIGAEAGGAITVKADHFEGNFQNCYWRNNSDNHFRYYGRAVSFPYQSYRWHYDKLFFENCTFTNIGRIVMMENNEYGSNIHLNHCTILNTVEWVIQSGGWAKSSGWIRNLSITNSLIVNPYLNGYRAIEVCGADKDYDDFLNGKCDPPEGALIGGITPVDSFGFEVDFTDYDRKLFIGNNNYVYEDWILDWYTNCDYCQLHFQNDEMILLYHPYPYIGEEAFQFIDSTDADGNKLFVKMNIDSSTMYFVDPEFIKPATNQDSLKLFLQAKWYTSEDHDWSYKPEAGFNQTWPLPENLAYQNTELQSAALGGFPLGDLNWYPDQMAAWEAQRYTEWETINNWLDYGSPTPSTVKEMIKPPLGDYLRIHNYPNPFNHSTSITFTLPQTSQVKIDIFNVKGQHILTLIENKFTAGEHSFRWKGEDKYNRLVESGIYYYRIRSEYSEICKKMLLIK